MSQPIRLLAKRIDRETIETLLQLLSDAQDGKIIGLAYVAIQPEGGYSGDLVGMCCNSRIFSLGACRALESVILDSSTKK